MQPLLFWVLLLVRGPSEGSSEVIPGHSGLQFALQQLVQNGDREAKLALLCLSRRYASTDMQHDIPEPSRDLDFRSNIQLTF